MFKSKLRPVATPQWEHQTLAGALALLWGNDNFDRPPVPTASLVTGIGLHDRAYGPLDNLPIGEIPQDDWIALTRRGFDMTWDDALADAIAKTHLHRLMTYGRAPTRQRQAAQMADRLAEHIDRHQLDAAVLARIDRITDLCDSIAFDFCFEAPAEGSVLIFPRNDREDELPVHYRVAGGTIELDPWPLSAPTHTGYLVAYQLAGYPATLEPVILPYFLRPATPALINPAKSS